MATFSNLVAALKNINAISELMLEKAQQELWEQLAALEKERLVQIELVFPLNQSIIEDDEEIKILLSDINAVNSKITSICETQKHALLEQIKSFNKNKKATQAYGAGLNR